MFRTLEGAERWLEPEIEEEYPSEFFNTRGEQLRIRVKHGKVTVADEVVAHKPERLARALREYLSASRLRRGSPTAQSLGTASLDHLAAEFMHTERPVG